MITKENAQAVASGLSTGFNSAVKNYLDNHEMNFEDISYEDALATLGNFVADLNSIAKGQAYEGYDYPKFNASCTVYPTADNKVSSIELCVKTPIRVVPKISETFTFQISDTFVKDMVEAYHSVLNVLLFVEFAKQNLVEINEKVAAIIAEGTEGSTDVVKVTFALDDNYIVSVSDEEVCYGISVDAALEAASMTMFTASELDENDETAVFAITMFNEDKKKFVDSIVGRTAPQIINGKVKLIEQLTGVSPKRRADKLIRLTYHTQAKYAFRSDNKEGYVEKTITLDGEDVKIFGILKKVEGEISVVLSPFNVATNATVDYDLANNYAD